MGAINTYRVADRAAEILFLDYEDCEVKWMKTIEDILAFDDLTFVSESNNIAGFVKSSTAALFFIINN